MWHYFFLDFWVWYAISVEIALGEILFKKYKIFIPIPGIIISLPFNVLSIAYFATNSLLKDFTVNFTPATLLKFVSTGPWT